MIRSWIWILLGGALLWSCGADSPLEIVLEPEEVPDERPDRGVDDGTEGGSDRPVDAEAILLDGVHVVHTSDGTVERDRAILVQDGRITRIAAAGSITPPDSARRPDVAGAWVTPGLFDMHVHMRGFEAEDYVRAGITTVRNMWGYSTLAALVDSIENGGRIGPRIHSLSSGLDGPPVYWPETQLITDPSQADSVVGAMQAAGYSEVKVYEDLAPAVYDSIVAATVRRGMTHAGHKPDQVSVERVIRSNQRSIEHLGGLMGRSRGELDRLIALSVEHGTWHSPTLAVLLSPPDDLVGRAARRDVVAALYAGGARLLIGTDAGIDRTPAGTSLVDEMALFAEAGVPLARMLRMVTVDAAEYLGVDDDRARIEPGYRADLALFADNPLDDLDHLRSVRGVVMGTRWITPDQE
jgi:hypothetical protein